MGVARDSGRAVLAACGEPLARDVQEQLDALNERWHSATRALQELRSTTVTQSLTSSHMPDATERARAALHSVRELLDTTSANPSDRTSLSIRLSLVKVRIPSVGKSLNIFSVY